MVAEDSRSDRYLSLLERERIAVLRLQNLGVRDIARLSRSPSTISRELKRGMIPGDRGVYDAGWAHARSREQARRGRVGVFARDDELRLLVQEKLQLQWNTEQISGPSIRTALNGMCVTRPSIRGSISVAIEG